MEEEETDRFKEVEEEEAEAQVVAPAEINLRVG